MASVHDVAAYLTVLDDEHGGDGLSNMKLQKLAYYAQGFYCAINDKPLFDEPIKAWTHGPVVPELYHAYKSCGSAPIPVLSKFDADCLTDDQKDIIEEVFEVFGQYSAWKLRNMTHEESPWRNHERASDVIPIDELTAYFKTRLH